MEASLPLLNHHFLQKDVMIELFAIRWFLTLFCQDFPIEYGTRVISMFLLYGFSALSAAALAMLDLC